MHARCRSIALSSTVVHLCRRWEQLYCAQRASCASSRDQSPRGRLLSVRCSSSGDGANEPEASWHRQSEASDTSFSSQPARPLSSAQLNAQLNAQLSSRSAQLSLHKPLSAPLSRSVHICSSSGQLTFANPPSSYSFPSLSQSLRCCSCANEHEAESKAGRSGRRCGGGSGGGRDRRQSR